MGLENPSLLFDLIRSKRFNLQIITNDSLDRLIHVLTKILEHEKVYVFIVDATSTPGENLSFNNLFEEIEQIKNGHAVSTIYGKY